MPQTIEDLWPVDLAFADIKTPVAILREQAYLLGQKTNNVIEGEVTSTTEDYSLPYDMVSRIASFTMSEGELDAMKKNNPTFYHSFYVKVPTLGNYRYKLFYVEHPINLYPVILHREGKATKCEDEEEFGEALRKAFADPNTLRIISSLRSQSLS